MEENIIQEEIQQEKFGKRLAAMSDLHGHLPKVDKCDVVCIAGDIVPLDFQRNLTETMNWFQYTFLFWVKDLPAERVILVPGNHDFALQDATMVMHWINDMVQVLPGIVDKLIFLSAPNVYADVPALRPRASYTWEGIKFYGDPHITVLSSWAFYTARPDIQYATIEDCDVLITHMPPKYQGVGASYSDSKFPREYGSQDLLEAVAKLPSVKYWFCGHVHTGNHNGVKFGNTMIYNVSMKNERYDVDYPVLYLDI